MIPGKQVGTSSAADARQLLALLNDTVVGRMLHSERTRLVCQSKARVPAGSAATCAFIRNTEHRLGSEMGEKKFKR